MRLLVVTPTLGQSPWLAETVSSVAALPFPSQHVLVAPTAITAELRRAFPSATVVNDPGGGMYAAINRGADSCDDWDLFTYINDDDSLLPDFRFVAECAWTNREVPFLGYGRVRLIDARGRRIGTIPVSRLPSLNRALFARRIEPLSQQGAVLTRPAWQLLGGFDTSLRLCGDSDFLARACIENVRLQFVNRTVAAFRLRPGQLTKNRGEMQAERERIDRALGLVSPRVTFEQLFASAVFRLSNVGTYLERIYRGGFVSYARFVTKRG